jgi:hypothetical protein
VVSVFCRLFTQKPAFVNEVENLHIEKYMTDRMVYVIASQVGYHVMCTFLFERGIKGVFFKFGVEVGFGESIEIVPLV